MQWIHRLLASDWCVRIKHIYREANKVEGGLAGLGCELNGYMLDEALPPVRQIVLANSLGVSIPRVIPM